MRTLAISLLLLFAAPFAAAADTTSNTPPAEPVNAPDDLAVEIYDGVTSGDWFLVAGAVLCLVTIGARRVLAKHWPAVEHDPWGIALVAGLAGLGAVGNALLADAELGTLTLLGAVKVWCAAVFAYVTAKKLWASRPKNVPMSSYISLLIVLSMAVGCSPGPGPGPVIGQTVIDCTGEHRAKIDALFVELTPLVFAQVPDWEAVYQRAKHAGAAIGGCALAELVQTYLGGRRAPREQDTWTARATLEEFRGAEAGGATFRTRFGNL